MSKLFLLSIALCFCFQNTKSQITKGNWLVGGLVNYSNSKSSGTASIDAKFRRLNILPTVGYFILDKTSLGLKANINLTKDKYLQPDGSETAITQNNFGAGPFIRYYFLPIDNRINLLSEANFFYSNLKSKSSNSNDYISNKTMDYSILAGCVIFLNSSVGLEFLAGYYNSKDKDIDSKAQSFKFSIGFQIHLEKDEN